MNTLTLHKSEWIGVDANIHQPRFTAYGRQQPCYSTGIPLDGCYGDSVPIKVVCPDGWHITNTEHGVEIFAADGDHVVLVHDGEHLTGITADSSVLLPIVNGGEGDG